MDKSEFRDIAPYEGQDVYDAIARLKAYPQFINNLADVLYKGHILKTSYKAYVFKSQVPPMLDEVHSYDDFQRTLTCKVFLATIERNSIEELSSSGLEGLDPTKAYLFISNHRDIVLDCALMDLVLVRGNFPLCEMAIGDNLLVNQFVTDLFKLNGGVTVSRGKSLREEYEASMRLSEYIWRLIGENNKSLWLAQRPGRAKDGIDNTTVNIIKMLRMYKRKDCTLDEAVQHLNIVPVAISYQYDPCDINKGREVIRTLKSEGAYKKKKYEDILNLLRGLRDYKGYVHISFGKPLEGHFETPDDVALAIDKQIHSIYRLWDTNYFAYDYMEDSTRFADKYESFSRKRFLNRYADLNSDVRNMILNTYANPVRLSLGEEGKGGLQ